MLRALIVVVGIAIPAVAFPCINGVERQRHQVVKQLVVVEELIDKAEYKEAKAALEGVPREIGDAGLRLRREDLRALLAIRFKADSKESEGWITTHFSDRVKKNPKDMRFKAWLAEALLNEGNSEKPLAILKELKKKDLMPDAFAYITLAKVSTGEDRDAAIEACKTRAKAKSICELPTTKS